ncbi:SLATT domain-containing protein [[Empedobacter] haloabium]|uniref:SLATT domain-containing protein n=1 Tax=[Empedobacter] haloabium TaxID=592317 RepID=A0ABZ1UVD4_9BURK
MVEPPYHPPHDADALILAWLRRARESQLGHYEMATMLERRSYWLGVPVIVISGVVGTSVFASIAAEVVAVEAKLAVGALSVLAAILSSLQTFFKFAERAEKHKTFGARYGAIRRELEAMHASGTAAHEPNYINVLRDKLDRLGQEAPAVSSAIHARVLKVLRADTTPVAGG